MHTDIPTLFIGKWTNPKTQMSYRKSSRSHTYYRQKSPMVLARSSASLPYSLSLLLHSDEPDQALKCPQRSISTAAFMFATRNLFWHSAQVIPTDRGLRQGGKTAPKALVL